ncbi:MAG TPA: VUT family protein [Candidatus Binatia bacterium]
MESRDRRAAHPLNWGPRARTAIPYVGIVVALNVGFSLYPEHDWFWSLLVGSVLVLRDYAQRVWGHACLLLMGLAAVLSYALGSPEVALASATAFAVSETVDWLVYTVTERPFADRVLLSTGASAPVDTVVFLVLAHLFSWDLLAIGVASKWTAGIVVWSVLRGGRSQGRYEAAAC